jgi:hypothetical protein
MAIYFIITFILLLFAFTDIIKITYRTKLTLFFLLFLILTTFIGLRQGIGFDSQNYEEVFVSQQMGLESPHQVEYGYLLLNKLFAAFGFSFSGLILFVAICSMGMKFLAIRKLAPLFFIPLLYYLSYYLIEYEMSAVRQAMAMGFAMLSLNYLKERRLYPFLMCIVAGSFFHISVIIFTPIFFFDRITFSTSTYLILVVISFCFIFTNLSGLLMNMIQVLPLGQFITSKLESYAGVNEVTGLTIGHIPYIAFCILFVYYRKIVNDNFYSLLLNGYIIGLFFSFVFSGSLGVLNRLTYYYLMLGGVLFSYILVNTRYLYNKVAIFGLLACFTLIKVAESILDKDAYQYYIPYKTITSFSELFSE